jgi:transposase
MPAKDVKAYVKRNKNDAADAEAICEAVRRPTMRFVRVKSAEQQGQLMQHRTRDLLMRQRTQVINALRAHMAELGIVAAQGREGTKALLAIIADDGDERLPDRARWPALATDCVSRGAMRRRRSHAEPGAGGSGARDGHINDASDRAGRSVRNFCRADVLPKWSLHLRIP